MILYVAAILLALSVLFGWLAWVARNAWRDIRKTRIFVACAIGCTVAFMSVGYTLIP